MSAPTRTSTAGRPAAAHAESEAPTAGSGRASEICTRPASWSFGAMSCVPNFVRSQRSACRCGSRSSGARGAWSASSPFCT
jgi:hypothetical protein